MCFMLVLWIIDMHCLKSVSCIVLCLKMVIFLGSWWRGCVCGTSKSVSLLHGECFVWQGTVTSESFKLAFSLSLHWKQSFSSSHIVSCIFNLYFHIDDLLLRVSSKQIYVYNRSLFWHMVAVCWILIVWTSIGWLFNQLNIFL